MSDTLRAPAPTSDLTTLSRQITLTAEALHQHMMVLSASGDMAASPLKYPFERTADALRLQLQALTDQLQTTITRLFSPLGISEEIIRKAAEVNRQTLAHLAQEEEAEQTIAHAVEEDRRARAAQRKRSASSAGAGAGAGASREGAKRQRQQGEAGPAERHRPDAVEDAVVL